MLCSYWIMKVTWCRHNKSRDKECRQLYVIEQYTPACLIEPCDTRYKQIVIVQCTYGRVHNVICFSRFSLVVTRQQLWLVSYSDLIGLIALRQMRPRELWHHIIGLNCQGGVSFNISPRCKNKNIPILNIRNPVPANFRKQTGPDQKSAVSS